MHDIDTVVLTHLHLDHASDLLALANARYLMKLPGLNVYGPEGAEEYYRTMYSAYQYLEKMEAFVHDLSPGEALSLKGFEISNAEAKHSVTSLGYRIVSGSEIVVYSGDTEPSPEIASLSEGADLLIHECSFPEPFEVTNHTTPRKLGSLITGVKKIVLTHLYPETRGHEKDMAREVSELSGLPAVAGRDMMTMIL